MRKINAFLLLAVLVAVSASAETVTFGGTVAPADDPEAEASGDVLPAGKSSDGSSSSGASSQDSSSTPSSFSRALSKLTVHGYLTQAWATANYVDGRLPGPGGVDPGPTFDEIALGIPEDGTFDYRTMALQFRYEISEKDIMVVQLSSRSLGDSPIENFEDEIELDWAFYERRLTDNTSVKVGRVQIPLGIFNEIRDVGTILPFYRPPFVFYREGTFTSETVDGINLSHTFAPQSDWALDFDVYAGDWTSFEQSFFDEGVSVADNEGYGFQLWLNTPVLGLRFGLGGHHRDVTGGSEGAIREVGATSRFDDWYASVDGVFNRFVIRGEYREFSGDPEVTPAFGGGVFDGTIILYYLQVGFHPTEKFRIYLQSEVNDTESSATTFTNDFDAKLREDLGIAINYLFSPNLVLKAEYHDVQGEDIGLLPVFGPSGLLLQPFTQEVDGGDYSIVSLSVSF
jgi:hypothetical protein